MNFHVMTLFPEFINEAVGHSIIKRAINNDLLSVRATDIRDFTKNKHKKVDDYTYGGGSGMLICCEPVYECYKSIIDKIGDDQTKKVIYMSPRGKTLTQQMSYEFSKYDNLIILCGHYEGVDQRVLDYIGAEDVSIGDYVLTGGELPALVTIDAVSRHIKGVLSNDNSMEEESFSDDLLEYPQFTRPDVWKDKKVPEVLLSGNHKKIEEYRLKESIKITKSRRPDLYEKYMRNKENNK